MVVLPDERAGKTTSSNDIMITVTRFIVTRFLVIVSIVAQNYDEIVQPKGKDHYFRGNFHYFRIKIR